MRHYRPRRNEGRKEKTMTQDAIRAYATFFAGAMDAPIIAAEDLMEILSISREDAEAIRRWIP